MAGGVWDYGGMEGKMMSAAHDSAACKRSPLPIHTQYVGKGYKALFVCPICAAQTWQHLNFLGRRNVVCHGTNFTKEGRVA